MHGDTGNINKSGSGHFRDWPDPDKIADPVDLFHLWCSVYTVPIVKLDPENIGVAVAISFLSCLLAEILAFLYPLPVYDRHLGFSTTVYTAQCLQWFHREAEPRKHRCSRWNFVANMYTSWDITLFHIYFRLMAAILDFWIRPWVTTPDSNNTFLHCT